MADKWITVDLMTTDNKQTRWVGPAATKAAAEELALELNPGATVTSTNIVKAHPESPADE